MNFRQVSFPDAMVDSSRGNAKIPQSEFQASGALSIVDQGKRLVAGYTNDITTKAQVELPAVIFGDHTRAFKFVDFPFAVGADGVKILRPRAGFDAKFLYYYLSCTQIPSAGYSRHFKFLKDIRVPQPSLSEQRRIAEILDRADAIRTKRRQILAHLDSLTQSIFHDKFSRVPLERVAIGTFAKVRTGSTPPRKDGENYGGEIPWVKTGEICGDVIYATSETVTRRGADVARLRLFPSGSVVIAMYGNGLTRGRSAVLGIPATTNQACAVVEPNETFDSTFLQAQLGLEYERLRGDAEGGNQPNLSVGRVSSFEVLNPPLEQQRAFSRIARRVGAKRNLVERTLAADDELFASLQARAFRGEL